MRRLGTAVLLLCACVTSPPAVHDSGVHDAGVHDAGTVDSGTPDAGPMDSGTDAGPPDAGPADAGEVDAGPPCVDDGGLACGLPPHAPYCEIMKSPRANPMVEYLVLKATGAFIADDANYSRAVSDWLELQNISFAAHTPVAGIELTDAAGYLVWFDDAGFELARDGGYRDWDCLNSLYAVRAGFFLHFPYDQANATNSYGTIEFGRLLKVDDLEADYATLPHVVGVEPDQYGCTCDCGTNSDTCLEIDAGTFTFIGNIESGQCDELWFRLVEPPDGGRQLELRDGGVPLDWLMGARSCAHHLRALRSFDAGF